MSNCKNVRIVTGKGRKVYDLDEVNSTWLVHGPDGAASITTILNERVDPDEQLECYLRIKDALAVDLDKLEIASIGFF